MKALVSTLETFTHTWISDWKENEEGVLEPIYSEIEDYQRVAEVEPDDKIFDVCETLFWVDCPNDCVADQWYYKDGKLKKLPEDIPNPEENIEDDV